MKPLGIVIAPINIENLERESEMHFLLHLFNNIDTINEDSVLKQGIQKSAKEIQNLYPATTYLYGHIIHHLYERLNVLVDDALLVHQIAENELNNEETFFGSIL